jgi:uncharacterized membrane protein YfcA
MPDWIIVTAASALAGCVDAIVGGGGLVLMPALFAVYPGAAPATLLGTNKGAAVWGTGWAALQFARRVPLNRRMLSAAAPAALVGALAGAWAASLVPPQGLRRALPFVLLAVLSYTVLKKDLGRTHAPHRSPRAERGLGAAAALVLGVYDGLFGPGTGSFLVFVLVRLLGYDFLHAAAHAKVLNTATNAAALTWFAFGGHVWWHLALLMAAANVAGSMLGTFLALRHGTGLVRVVFLLVVGALILRTGYDAFLR